MKKIAILTLPLHNNYGGILQNYALQVYLDELGCKAYTINYKPQESKYSLSRLILSSIKRLFKKNMGDKNIIFLNPQKQLIFLKTPGRFQNRFIKSYINEVKVDGPLSSDFDKKYDFDIYIVGSDQAWRPRYSPNLKNFYLDFVDNKNAKKIAYATSFGVDYWEASEEITPYLSNRAQEFDAISVREKSAVDLCKKYLNVNAVQALDPTMLLGINDYRKLVKAENEDIDIGKNKVCVYILDIDKDRASIINDVCKIKGLEVYRVGKPNKKGFPSIESWINGFDKADFIITDSFHGTVFSILFNKPFISIGNTGRGITRFKTVLDLFNLSSKLVFNYEDFKSRKSEILNEIDYSLVNQTLTEHRLFSTNFLKEAIKNNHNV